MTGTATNALGFNSLDNYLYGSNFVNNVTSLIRISGDGSFTTLFSLNRTGSNWNMGEVDEQGHYWAAFNGGPWIEIGLAPGSSTYGQTIASGTATPQFTPVDWAYTPGGGDNLYGLGHNSAFNQTTLMAFDQTNHNWTTLTNFGNVAGRNVWGAIYTASDSTLIASENSSGQLWRFPLPAAGEAPARLANGPASTGSNDGARCLLGI